VSPKADAKSKKQSIEELAINTIRFLSVDAVEKAKSGHPGMPMGMAAAAYTIWTQFLQHNPKNPRWPNRDRFVLSNGHGSMLLYSLLHLTGYDVSLNDLKNFRQWESKTPGHPEYGHTPGVETTTGPLGQGISTAVGMAISQRYLNQLLSLKPKPLLDYKIYGICSDGDLMEGVASEAASMAGHLGLGNLIFIYDDNHITIDGETDLAFSENVAERFKSYNWHVVKVTDANDIKAVAQALKEGQKETSRPTLLIARSHIGYGSPNKADKASSHGAPLGEDEVKLAKRNLHWPEEPPFYIPEGVKAHFEVALANGAKKEKEWNDRYDEWAKNNPDQAKLCQRLESCELPPGWEKYLPDFQNEEKMATRQASGKVINALAPILPELTGGSADLAPSNNTLIKGEPALSKKVTGRNMHFGVREHGMGAILNGMALSPKLIPYGGTFLIFSDYMKGAIRLGALMKQRVIYVFTHDSIGLGEDGPTHQPIEQLAMLRATPNLTVIRPADATETAAAWKWAIEHKNGPTALVLTRQGVPVLKKDKYPAAGAVDKGGYILKEASRGSPSVILIATGSEVSLALNAQEQLEKEGTPTRVVSLPSFEIFEQQPQEYRDSVLPPAIRKRVAIEALSTFGWEKYVGLDGAIVGMTSFGASAPAGTLMEKFGFTVGNIVEKARNLL
jgi:transketolase